MFLGNCVISKTSCYYFFDVTTQLGVASVLPARYGFKIKAKIYERILEEIFFKSLVNRYVRLEISKQTEIARTT